MRTSALASRAKPAKPLKFPAAQPRLYFDNLTCSGGDGAPLAPSASENNPAQPGKNSAGPAKPSIAAISATSGDGRKTTSAHPDAPIAAPSSAVRERPQRSARRPPTATRVA